MTCQACRELLTDYQRGELPDAQDVAVFEHTSTCTDCREELAATNELVDSLHATYAPELELPMSVVAGVRQAVRTERTHAFGNALRTLFRPIVLAPTAVAAVLVAGVITYVHNGSTVQPTMSVDYLVRQHVVHTMDSQSGDRAWNAYLLTSASYEDTHAPAK
jgi:anti-sigma factor RsiW